MGTVVNEHVGAWELPERWEWHALGDVCEINPRKPSVERDEDAPTSFVPMAALDEERGAITDMQVKPYNEVNRGYTYFEENDVLFAKITPCMDNGKSAIARGLIDGIGFGSTEFHRIRPGGQLIPEWVHLFVRQQSFRDEAASRFRGSVGQQRVPKEFLQSHLIPVPPTMATQRRIVARIEELFAHIEEARRLSGIAGGETERLMEAVTVNVFPDPEKPLPSGWQVSKIADISQKPQYGYTESAREEPIGPRFLRITDIQEGEVNWETVPFCPCTEQELEKYRLKRGDIVFARSGATTGKTFLVRDCPEAIFASYLIRLQIREGVLPEYVYAFFQSPYYWQQIQPRGAAQPNVNATILSELTVPIPLAIEDQRDIVADLEDVWTQEKALKRAQEAAGAELNHLEQSILAQAFRGDL